MKLTSEIFASYLRCKYKGYLKFIGEKGILKEFEKLSNETLQLNNDLYRKRVLSKLSFTNVPENILISSNILKSGFD
jgi:hypothetical protein